MSELKLSGSVSQSAMEAAILEMEELVAGRIGDEDFERVYGPRWAKLKAMGMPDDALIDAYVKQALQQEGGGLVDEKQQARLTLARYDERHAGGKGKRRKKSEKPTEGNAKTSASGTAGGASQSSQQHGSGATEHGSNSAGGETKAPLAGAAPTDPDGNGWEQ